MLHGGPPTTHTQAADIADQGQRINLVLFVRKMLYNRCSSCVSVLLLLTQDCLTIVVIFSRFLIDRGSLSTSRDDPEIFLTKVVRLLQFSDLF